MGTQQLSACLPQKISKAMRLIHVRGSTLLSHSTEWSNIMLSLESTDLVSDQVCFLLAILPQVSPAITPNLHMNLFSLSKMSWLSLPNSKYCGMSNALKSTMSYWSFCLCQERRRTTGKLIPLQQAAAVRALSFGSLLPNLCRAICWRTVLKLSGDTFCGHLLSASVPPLWSFLLKIIVTKHSLCWIVPTMLFPVPSHVWE